MWSDYICSYWCIHTFSWTQSSLNALLITKAGDRHFVSFPVFGGALCCHFDNLRCHRRDEVFLFGDPFVFHWLPYYIQSTQFTRVPVMADQPEWWVQTIRRIMLNTFVTIYCANFRPIKISSVRFCSMDRDIILGSHKFSQLANIDYQWTPHIFQPLY